MVFQHPEQPSRKRRKDRGTRKNRVIEALTSSITKEWPTVLSHTPRTLCRCGEKKGERGRGEGREERGQGPAVPARLDDLESDAPTTVSRREKGEKKKKKGGGKGGERKIRSPVFRKSARAITISCRKKGKKEGGERIEVHGP